VARATFEAELRPSGRGGGHLVEVPDDVVRTLRGRRRIPVVATFKSVPYRGSIMTMGGAMIVGVTKAIIAAAGVAVGDTLTVVVENDDEPREVDVPPELEKALRRNKAAREYFASLAYSHRPEVVGFIAEAKKPETRARRVERTVQTLAERAAAATR
jgi:hypothetical protein